MVMKTGCICGVVSAANPGVVKRTAKISKVAITFVRKETLLREKILLTLNFLHHQFIFYVQMYAIKKQPQNPTHLHGSYNGYPHVFPSSNA